MYIQTFSANELYHCSFQSERRNFSGDKEQFLDMIQKTAIDKILSGSFHIMLKEQDGLILNAQPKTSNEHLCQDLVFRKLYRNIKKIYKVSPANRGAIIKQMLVLLKEDIPLWVIRLDVKQFFESIDRGFLMSRIEDKARLSSQSILLLKEIDCYLRSSNRIGLPRGLAISSALSEEYMKYFDLDVKRMEGVYYYARYVDDIIIFCSTETAQKNVWDKIPSMLRDLKLSLNTEKSYKWSNSSKQALSYLGYNIRKVGKKKVEVSIADKKIKMIKTRITRAFAKYTKERDFEMLRNRIKFLTGNFTINSKATLAPIKVGVFFNYKEITIYKQLKEIDKYYQQILHCKRGALCCKFLFSPEQVKCLEKYSFEFGFNSRVNHFFNKSMLTKIKQAWL